MINVLAHCGLFQETPELLLVVSLALVEVLSLFVAVSQKDMHCFLACLAMWGCGCVLIGSCRAHDTIEYPIEGKLWSRMWKCVCISYRWNNNQDVEPSVSRATVLT